MVIEDYDRAAPKGVGAVKVAGNYAADMMPNMMAKQAGYPIGLYLDAKTNSLVEVSFFWNAALYVCKRRMLVFLCCLFLRQSIGG